MRFDLHNDHRHLTDWSKGWNGWDHADPERLTRSLRPEVEEWLEASGKPYVFDATRESLGQPGKYMPIYYLDIPDDDHALLFKLRWL